MFYGQSGTERKHKSISYTTSFIETVKTLGYSVIESCQDFKLCCNLEGMWSPNETYYWLVLEHVYRNVILV